MKLYFDNEVIVEYTCGYDSATNGNVEYHHQTINTMVCIQLLYCGKNDELMCFFYHYNIWTIACLINKCH